MRRINAPSCLLVLATITKIPVAQLMPKKSPTPRSKISVPLAVTQRNRSSIAARLRSLRLQRGYTLEQVSVKTTLDRGYLSRLERGEKTPSVAALMTIASALGVQMAHLFGETTGSSAITVMRHDEYMPFPGPKDGQDHSFMMLLSQSESRRLSLVMALPGAGGTAGSAEHPGEEILFVVQGRVKVSFADRHVVLSKGDCVHFDGHLKHSLCRIGGAPAQALIILGQDLQKIGRAP